MRLFGSLSAAAGLLCLGATCAAAQGVAQSEADDQVAPYHTHVDRRHGHDHVYPDRGAIVRDVPRWSTVVNYAGITYRFANGVWYERRGPAYIVVAPPIGLIVPSLPGFATAVQSHGDSYLYADDVYYRARPELGGYEVVNDPLDVTKEVRSMARRSTSSGSPPAIAEAEPSGTPAETPGEEADSETAPTVTALTAPNAVAAPAPGAGSGQAAAAAPHVRKPTHVTKRPAAWVAHDAGHAATATDTTAASADAAAAAANAAAASAAAANVDAAAANGAATQTVGPVQRTVTGTRVATLKAAPAGQAGPQSPPPVPALPSVQSAPPAQVTPAVQAPVPVTPPPSSTARASVPPAGGQATTPAASTVQSSSTQPPGESSAPTRIALSPENGQGADEQARDRYDCYRFAVDQSGFDPLRTDGSPVPADVDKRQSDYARAQAACLERRGYSLR